MTEQCKSEFEANSKVKLLKVPRINQSFCKELGLQKPIIMVSSELNLLTLEDTQILYKAALALKQKTKDILIIN